MEDMWRIYGCPYIFPYHMDNVFPLFQMSSSHGNFQKGQAEINAATFRYCFLYCTQYHLPSFVLVCVYWRLTTTSAYGPSLCVCGENAKMPSTCVHLTVTFVISQVIMRSEKGTQIIPTNALWPARRQIRKKFHPSPLLPRCFFLGTRTANNSHDSANALLISFVGCDRPGKNFF